MSLVQYLNQYKNTFKIPSNNKSIDIRPITTGQMKNLLMYEDNNDPFIVDGILDDIINGCVITEGFNIDNLTIQDRFSLLIEIRKISKGEVYQFQWKCPECKTINNGSINLDELEIIPFKSDVETKIEILPGFSVFLDYVRRKYQKQALSIVNNIDNLSSKQKLIEIATYTYALAMKGFETPDGQNTEPTLDMKVELLNSLDNKLYSKIVKWYSDNNYGIVFKHNFSCINCKHKQLLDIPISSFFG